MARDRPRARPGGGRTGSRNDPLGGGITSTIAAAQLRHRREAAWRLPPLCDGHRDPLDAEAASHRHGTRGLAQALDHLDAAGLCACWVAPRPHRSAA